MGKLCMYCMEEYRNDDIMVPYKINEVGVYQDCPKRTCDGKIYTIDDSIISTITILNSKGYHTYSSCAGHHLEHSTECYIEFTNEVKSIPVLPVGFKLRKKTIEGKTRLAIYCKPNSEDPIDQFTELLDFAQILYEWAIELDFNFSGLNIAVIDLGSEYIFSPLVESAFLNVGKTDAKEKMEKQNKEKLKHTSNKSNGPDTGELRLTEVTKAKRKRCNSSAIAKSESKKESKNKSGYPKKNKD
ncbi:hypothetical protein [Lysinibacillus fusiformis]|uniref:hypothetical protein n=1 Tax=Lysinibacillus fusiformis TaxID=28031 RepID=UPI0035BFC779|nr:hypothetical protein QYY55_24740 [Lysinibacillus fusiformis]